MKLIGSTTSPFVRRIKLLTNNHPIKFVDIDIFSEQGADMLSANNPARKVPVLQDGDVTIYDSRVIFNYLIDKLSLPEMTWQQQNLLTIIDAANDSLVSILLCQRSGFDITEDKLFFNLQHQRVENVLLALAKQVENKAFDEWHYPSICLFCLLDWALFRNLAQWQHIAPLNQFYQHALTQSLVKETDPRI
ncbi:glutathione S-transferase family protein [Thalassotalea eurytherma]|uniref:GST N-terminal domain-containing protein n=1 Tax=Thalassotalea eurytherma TaxID=1144278 RepID=A0ABQ6H5L4_9GAMM|nr:glutathione S-transferase family protein [Thalassotalea eurytherma]GLX83427.1 hypothetical protein theurythT_28800 [Thalassotalea eurytherma]